MPDDTHSGVMLALIVPPIAAGKLIGVAQQAGLNTGDVAAADELHITLAYLGDISDVQAGPDTLLALLKVFAAEHSALRGEIGGIARFNAADDVTPVVALFDSPEIPAFRQDLVEMLSEAGVNVDGTHGFVPHITLAYVPVGREVTAVELDRMPITFNDIVLAWGGDQTPVPLGGEMKAIDPTKSAELLVELMEFKAGARNNAEDLKRLQQIHDMAKANGATCDAAAKANADGSGDPTVMQKIHDLCVANGANCPGMAEAKSVDDKAAQEKRAKQYGIAAKDGGSVTKPGEFSDVPDSAFGDPVNYSYPADEKHAKAALSYFNQSGQREAGGYTTAEWDTIGARLAKLVSKSLTANYEYKD
ncbi:MAG: 2'-5' RNA ligase family protein, partial [Anaerolineae bacterium]